jgi:Zn-finger protein
MHEDSKLSSDQHDAPEKSQGNFSHFSHEQCEYFPCHDTDDLDHFNCLFCYCPLYPLGDDCGGVVAYTVSGIKDCSHCLIPHSKHGFEFVQKHIDGLINLMKEINRRNSPTNEENKV